MITNRTTSSMTMALGLLISMAFVVILPVIAIGAEESVPFQADVFPGQKLVIKFRFTAPPTTPEGLADILLINGGGANRGFIATRVSLRVGKLIGSFTNTDGNAFSIFTAPSSLYTLRVNPADLSALFLNGRAGVLEYQPIFDTNTVGAFINYQFTTFTAARAISGDAFVEALPTPVIMDVQIRPDHECD